MQPKLKKDTQYNTSEFAFTRKKHLNKLANENKKIRNLKALVSNLKCMHEK